MTAIAVTPPRRGLVHQADSRYDLVESGTWRFGRGVTYHGWAGVTLCGRRFSGWVGGEAAFGREACGDCAHYAEREAGR